ncbi:SRPBCC family protein [Amnibacterium setariae]|uniref:SRPBCC family protein n=1 Tax=Amnibacterium setariae TaxID=2306585 RepID=UPI0026ACC32A|nr:hypothetical protein [Amnibacterium setariae]
MPVLDVEKDLDRLTLTVVAEFAAPVERVWSLYADPRRLERHWGPPGYPATRRPSCGTSWCRGAAPATT